MFDDESAVTASGPTDGPHAERIESWLESHFESGEFGDWTIWRRPRARSPLPAPPDPPRPSPAAQPRPERTHMIGVICTPGSLLDRPGLARTVGALSKVPVHPLPEVTRAVRATIRPEAVEPQGPRAVAEVWPRDPVSRLLDGLGRRVVLFRAGDWVFVNFGLLSGLGAVVGLCGMAAITAGQGLRPELFALLALACSGGIVLGSWLLSQLLDYRLLLANPGAALRRPSFVSWGGLLAIPLVLLPFARYAEVDVLLVMDAVARIGPVGHALGRVGCLTYGCCYGRPTASGPAITYRSPHAKAVRIGGLAGVPLHPAPLYEIALLGSILVCANLAAAFDAPTGVPWALAMILYGLGRLAIECVRDNDGRYLLGGLAVNHAVALATALGGVGLLVACLMDPSSSPAIRWASALEASWLLPVLGLGGVVVSLGFGAHRGDVGRW
jgi:phosphatidylglycerol:prolipoprotein diacylglycerol transferase